MSHIFNHRLHGWTMFDDVEVNWKQGRNSQTNTWHLSTESWTVDSSHVWRWKLFGCGRRGNPHQDGSRLGEMGQNYLQCHRYSQSLFSCQSLTLVSLHKYLPILSYWTLFPIFSHSHCHYLCYLSCVNVIWEIDSTYIFGKADFDEN